MFSCDKALPFKITCLLNIHHGDNWQETEHTETTYILITTPYFPEILQLLNSRIGSNQPHCFCFQDPQLLCCNWWYKLQYKLWMHKNQKPTKVHSIHQAKQNKFSIKLLHTHCTTSVYLQICRCIYTCIYTHTRTYTRTRLLIRSHVKFLSLNC